MMAGRSICVTRVALGTVRVQRSIGMMSEVLKMAASLCRQHGTNPRGSMKRTSVNLSRSGRAVGVYGVVGGLKTRRWGGGGDKETARCIHDD